MLLCPGPCNKYSPTIRLAVANGPPSQHAAILSRGILMGFMISCPACEREISSDAVSCPKCGEPNPYEGRRQADAWEAKRDKEREVERAEYAKVEKQIGPIRSLIATSALIIYGGIILSVGHFIHHYSSLIPSIIVGTIVAFALYFVALIIWALYCDSVYKFRANPDAHSLGLTIFASILWVISAGFYWVLSVY